VPNVHPSDQPLINQPTRLETTVSEGFEKEMRKKGKGKQNKQHIA
jgi:hypothetical protein